MAPEKPDEKPGLPDPPYTPEPMRDPRKKALLIIALLVFFGLLVGGLFLLADYYRNGERTEQTGMDPKSTRSTATPQLEVESVLEGREHVWEIAFLPDRTMVFTERRGTISAFRDSDVHELATIDDVYARGEGGLTGLAVDPAFATNRYVFTCFNSTQGDIRVVRWKVSDDTSGLSDRTDIITGLPANPSGRHSGCRMAFGPDGYLWIGTGDTAQDLTPQPPQDPRSLGGKILRVDRDGKAASGNLGGDFDPRIYSYGHRNTQGLAFFAKEIGGVPGISVEHGPDVDDEMNPLKPGNFGWAPPDGPYDESIPMTDKSRFPDAVEAIWSSGSPTLAPAGAAVLKGNQWKGWEDAVAVAMLKTQHLRIFLLDDNLKLIKEEQRFDGDYGRLRAVTLGPDGALYVGSSNGTDDKIIRVTPQ